MKVYVKMKAVGKRKPILNCVPYDIPKAVYNLEELLSAFVRLEVNRYNQKGTDVQLLPYLTDREINNQLTVGKVGFGSVCSGKKADENKALKNALQCFKDGLVRVFQNDVELTDLKQTIQLTEEDCFTFIRLTFLAGRLW